MDFDAQTRDLLARLMSLGASFPCCSPYSSSSETSELLVMGRDFPTSATEVSPVGDFRLRARVPAQVNT